MVIGILTVSINYIFWALNYFTTSSNNMASRISSSRSSTVDTTCSSMQSRKRRSVSPADPAKKRLMTFENMPTPHLVGPNVLAKKGFFYSRKIQSTRCTKCKKVVKTWQPGDDPASPSFHEQGCEFAEVTEPIDLSMPVEDPDEPEPMEDAPAQPMEDLSASAVKDRKQPTSLPATIVKIFPQKNTHTNNTHSLNLMKVSTIDSSSSTCGTDELPIPRLTPVDMIQDDSSRGSTPLPSFTQTPRRNGHVIETEPRHPSIWRRERPATPQQNHGATVLPEEIAALDMRVSANRLESFHIFWSRSNVFRNIYLLVMCGFFCFGQGDAIQCFYCGTILANWSRNDDPKKRHLDCSPHCRFAQGEDCGNIPLPVVAVGQRNQSQSSRHPLSNARRQSHSSNTRRTTSRGRSAAPEPSLPEAYANMTPSQRERNNLMLEFPCENPVNEAMRDERKRLESFENSSFRANTQLRMSNRTLAQAGMYYNGVGDCTTCWYCGGGLKFYTPNDDPWVEHAKYYPQCEHLLQQRGPAWVASISVQFPNLERPPLPVLASHGQPSSGARPVVESNTPGRSVLDEAMRTQPAEAARRMEFSEQQIREAQQRRILSLGSCYPTTESLMEALLNPHADPATLEAAASQPVATTHQTPAAQPFQPGPRPQRQNIVIAGGNFVGPNALEAAAASAAASQQSTGGNQPSSGQPRRNVVIAGGNFIGPSIVNGRLHQTPSRSTSSNVFTVNGQSLQDYLATQGEPMEVQTATGTVRFYTSPNAHVTHSHGAQFPQPPISTGSNVSPSHAAVSTAPTVTNTSSQGISTTPSTRSPATTSTTTTPSRPAASAEERLEEMERERLCKICLNAPAEILFQPCGHVCSCLDCSRRVTDCPVCRRRIIRYVRIYQS